MRCGLLVVTGSGLGADRAVAAGVAAEGVGAELVVVAAGRPGAGDPLVILGALAERTARVALVCGVSVGRGERVVGVWGKEVTTLDRVSGGRAGLVLGGGPGAWRRAGGVGEGPATGASAAAQEEALWALDRLFRRPPASVEGRRVVLRGAPNLPPPRQPGGPSLATLVPPAGRGGRSWRLVPWEGPGRGRPRGWARGTWVVLPADRLLRARPEEVAGVLAGLRRRGERAAASGAAGVVLGVAARAGGTQGDETGWLARLGAGLAVVRAGGRAR
ncbi:LLM class flavin-dependent oxidoreductase [Aciditerrimonas ferrireducens]|uniref:LLM class flavin-dependent oxidoreductase n=1 Tax=Aciditerrimonas ferrireducens TaxID=667306 RepID=UPI00289A062E|nr:LLM class flavin-dependent oxidoreductase [Aciditerrimonas ferrireducens]